MATKCYGLKHRFGDDDPLDFSSVKGLDEFKKLVQDATLIAWVDRRDGTQGDCIFGRETLRAIIEQAIEPQNMVLVVFALDPNTDEVEKLAAAVQVTKGYHEAA